MCSYVVSSTPLGSDAQSRRIPSRARFLFPRAARARGETADACRMAARSRGAPRPKFPTPLAEHRGGAHHQRRFVQSVFSNARAETRTPAPSSETHLVADDTPGALAVKLPQPLDGRALMLQQSIVRRRVESKSSVEDDLILVLVLEVVLDATTFRPRAAPRAYPDPRARHRANAKRGACARAARRRAGRVRRRERDPAWGGATATSSGASSSSASGALVLQRVVEDSSSSSVASLSSSSSYSEPLALPLRAQRLTSASPRAPRASRGGDRGARLRGSGAANIDGGVPFDGPSPEPIFSRPLPVPRPCKRLLPLPLHSVGRSPGGSSARRGGGRGNLTHEHDIVVFVVAGVGDRRRGSPRGPRRLTPHLEAPEMLPGWQTCTPTRPSLGTTPPAAAVSVAEPTSAVRVLE